MVSKFEMTDCMFSKLLKTMGKSFFRKSNIIMLIVFIDITVCISHYQILRFLKLYYKVTTYKVGAEPLSVRMSLGCC